MALSSPYTIPSLIGGVSEQSPQDRPPSTCEAQENCVNDALNGCMPRPGGVVIGSLEFDMEDPFIHDIRRSDTEHYKVLIEDGVAVIINIIDGTVCSQTDAGVVTAYLTHTGPARLAFAAVTVEDTTFIVNKQRTVLMDDALSAPRPNRAMFYFKSGSYKTKYVASITTGLGTLTAQYTTPDNTDPDNALYITTNRLAKELMDAFEAARTAASPTFDGFTFSQNGSAVIVTRSGSSSFDLDTEDGMGDTQLIAITAWAKKFEDLPSRAPNNFVVGVRGSKSDQRDDYWLRYVGAGNTTGYWEEIAKPSTPTSLDVDTMPHLLLNTGLNTFTCSKGTWNTRISGDGVLSSKDPTFIGRKINAIDFISGRLALVTEGTFMLSRARNAYCFFPDTAQVRLDTDPVGFEIANGKSTIITGTVATSGKLFFWGNENQMRLDSGDQPLTEEFADIIPSSNYEYDGNYQPVAMGMSSVMFGSKVGTSVKLKEVMYRNGLAMGEVPLNDQCPKLVQGALRQIAVGNTAGILVVLTTTLDVAYIYQWLNQGDQRVQTAWNTWSFPAVDKIVSATVRGNTLYLLFQIGDHLVIERFDIDPADLSLRDIRLDHRVDQTGADYEDEGDGVYTATLSLPFDVPTEDRDLFRAILNEDDGTGTFGGEPLAFSWLSPSEIVVTMPDDAPDAKFWFGAVPAAAKRTFSQLYVQTRQGTLLPDRNLIDKIKISHAQTSEYRVEVRDVVKDQLVYSHEFHGRQAITPTPNNKVAKTRAGEQNFAVDRKSHEVEITLINDTIFPSRWVQAEYSFAASR